MSRESTVGVILGMLAIGAVVAFALGGTSVETTVLPPVSLGDPQDVEPTAAVITAMRKSEGFSIFGLELGGTTHYLSVQFYETPGCWEVVSFGELWPTSFEECSGAVAIAGEISGIGNTGTGESMISVDVEVPEACYVAVARGGTWPSTASACVIEQDR